ncbi:MAG: universal stress protein [Planctomycetota bacterium]|nr:MAG: universal stress protein [Planctomycetota bacterium]
MREGLLLTALLREVEEEDLLAIGRTGRFSRAGVGSTTKALVTKAPCPVLVAQGLRRPVNRVLAVYDGHGPSEGAVRWARSLAEQARWPLAVLAAPCEGLSLEEAVAKARQLAGDEADVVAAGPQERDAALAARAGEQSGAWALLVMGAYEHSLLRELLRGSETAAALNCVEGPIVLAHQAPTARAAARA